MIDHISLPVSDYARSRAFYDKALGALGYKVAMEITDSPDYRRRRLRAGRRCPSRRSGSAPAREPGPAPVSPDGQHIAFRAADRAAVDAFYARGAGRRRHATTAPRACARTTIPTTMPPSSSTRTGTGWRRCAISRSERLTE